MALVLCLHMQINHQIDREIKQQYLEIKISPIFSLGFKVSKSHNKLSSKNVVFQLSILVGDDCRVSRSHLPIRAALSEIWVHFFFDEPHLFFPFWVSVQNPCDDPCLDSLANVPYNKVFIVIFSTDPPTLQLCVHWRMNTLRVLLNYMRTRDSVRKFL